MIRRIDAAVLFVENLDKCMMFYRDILGLQVVFSDANSFALRLEGQDFVLLKLSAAAGMISEEAVSLAGHPVPQHPPDEAAALSQIRQTAIPTPRTPASPNIV